jgi:hypothetical protein
LSRVPQRSLGHANRLSVPGLSEYNNSSLSAGKAKEPFGDSSSDELSVSPSVSLPSSIPSSVCDEGGPKKDINVFQLFQWFEKIEYAFLPVDI